MKITEKIQSLAKEMQRNPDRVIEETKDLINECQTRNDRESEFQCHLLLADVYTHLGNYAKAKESLEPAKKLAEIDKKEKQIARLHNYFGTLYWYLGEYSKALHNYLELKNMAEKLQDKKLLFNAYNNIGMIYWIKEKYKEAEETYIKGSKLLENRQSRDAANVLNNIGLCQLRTGEFEKSEKNLLAALEIKRKVNDQWGICHCLLILARLDLNSSKLDEVEKIIKEAIPLAEKLEAKQLIRDCYRITADYFEKKKKYKKAYEWQNRYHAVWQEMYQKERNQEIMELQKEVEIKEKDKETEIFRLKNIELKNMNDQIKQQKKELNNKLKKLKGLNEKLQKEVDEQLIQIREKDQMLIMQSRRAALGEMFVCIAHQWKQPINGISLITQNLTDAWEFDEFDEDFLYKNCQHIFELVEYMNTTINDFRNFFDPNLSVTDFNIRENVNKTLQFMDYTLKHDQICVETKLKDIIAHGYPNYYNQVVINIINNARDVLYERKIKKPLIKIKSYKSPRTKKSVLTIEDNAGGIKLKRLNQVFQPYFTTKPRDKGTGLGLYMSKVLIEKNMKGRLSVKNTDNGACFRIEI